MKKEENKKEIDGDMEMYRLGSCWQTVGLWHGMHPQKWGTKADERGLTIHEIKTKEVNKKNDQAKKMRDEWTS